MWIKTFYGDNVGSHLVSINMLTELWVSDEPSEIRGSTVEGEVITLYEGTHTTKIMAYIETCIRNKKELCDLPFYKQAIEGQNEHS